MEKQELSKPLGEIWAEYLPEIDINEAGDFLLFRYTGWPAFWDGDPEECLREQLAQLAEMIRLNLDACYCCGKLRLRSQVDSLGFCKQGRFIMRRAGKVSR